MPHFILDCSAGLMSQVEPATLLQTVHATALATELFAEKDIKVRIRPYEHHIQGGERGDFLHVFAHIMGGRSSEQKRSLADQVVISLKALLPEVPIISIDVQDIQKDTHCNRAMV